MGYQNALLCATEYRRRESRLTGVKPQLGVTPSARNARHHRREETNRSRLRVWDLGLHSGFWFRTFGFPQPLTHRLGHGSAAGLVLRLS